MIILGIESSCDDTSVALVDASGRGFTVLAEKTASQVEIHKKYGGVVPEIAGRMHAEQILPVIEEVINHLNIQTSKHLNTPIKPDVIAVTSGPGLITGLLVGIEAAKTLSYLWKVPLVGVNHIEGHMLSVLLPKNEVKPGTPSNLPLTGGETTIPSPFRGGAGGVAVESNQNEKTKINIEFPALALVVSGGHTELILMKDYGDYKIVGKTLDDAAGECFDKVAKLLGLDYPGGPKISKLALAGRTDAILFPRPMINSKDYNFSFAGLKTSALYWLRDNAKQTPIGYELLAMNLSDFCASFEQAIVDVLVQKTINAVNEYEPNTVLLGGGVSANKKLRETLSSQLRTLGSDLPATRLSSRRWQAGLLAPNLKYAMDNGAMIAVAGYFHAIKKEFTDWKLLTADPNWKVDKPPQHLST